MRKYPSLSGDRNGVGLRESESCLKSPDFFGVTVWTESPPAFNVKIKFNFPWGKPLPDLKSDIVGRISRLPLRPNEKNALLPLMEAISNSIHAVTDRFGAEALLRGKITIRIIRQDNGLDSYVDGFEIEDNGIGFNDTNYESFRTPDSRHKEKRGGKGVGRLAWLKVFQEIQVDSSFYSEGRIKSRAFDFRLTETDQIVERKPPICKEQRTLVRFRSFTSPFQNKCTLKKGIIEQRIAAHFIPLFLAGNAPKILVSDEVTTDIENLFSQSIVNQKTDKIKIGDEESGFELDVWSLKCERKIRFDRPGHNFAFISGDSRSVIEFCLDEQIGLTTLDGQHVYLACASSTFLNEKVNSERTAFTLDASEIEDIKRAIAKCGRDFLQEYVSAATERKIDTTRSVISENPQFMFLLEDIKGFAEKLQPNAFDKEQIFLELSRFRYRTQKNFDGIKKHLREADKLVAAVDEKVRDYAKFIASEKIGALAEYVTRRKAILDLFENLLEFKDPSGETHHREDALHRLFCPMRIDSGSLSIEDHNLWLLDDRLAFFNYFASDKPLSSYTISDSMERPDLAFFYDSCVAWRERESTDSVVLVEFKRPMRSDYPDKDRDPVQQVLSYVNRLKVGNGETDIRGRAIYGIRPHTSFHCYVVCDITPELEAQIIGRFDKTPDCQGYFGYTNNPRAFVEIVPYSKVLQDARLRNVIFFQQLGITNTG